jgi:hypothetical protein
MYYHNRKGCWGRDGHSGHLNQATATTTTLVKEQLLLKVEEWPNKTWWFYPFGLHPMGLLDSATYIN